MKHITILFVLIVFANVITAQNLKRRAFFGAGTENLSDSLKKIYKVKNGIVVTQIRPNSTASLLKITEKDIITKINNKEISNTADYKRYISELREKDAIELLIIRNSKVKTIKGFIQGVPKETAEKFEIMYDEVPFKNGYIRTILTKPKNKTNMPVILFIPGFYCYSLDNVSDNHPYMKLINGLADKGYAVLRVEKSGTGDCMNTPSCDSMDFVTEVENFAVGLKKLKTYTHLIDTSKIIIWGHSLGGLIAPLIASQIQVSGIITFGAGVSSWYEYLIEVMRYQSSLYQPSYVETEKKMPLYFGLLYKFMIEKQSPIELSKNDEYKQILVREMQFDGKSSIWTRSYRFWQQIQDAKFYDAWVKSNAHVLIMRGEYDLQSFNERAYMSIVECINAAYPNYATFLNIPKTNHSFVKVNSMKHGIEADATYVLNNFNTQIIEETHNWIQKSIVK